MSYHGLVERWLGESDRLAAQIDKQKDWGASLAIQNRVEVYRECAADLAILLKKQAVA